MVLIKGKDLTEEIHHIERNSRHTIVSFKKRKSYSYAPSNVEWHSDPERIPVENVRFSIDGNLLSDVEEAFRFGKWIKLFYGTGGSECCESSALSVQNMSLSDGRSKDILAYFRELAEGASLRTGDDDSLLAIKYRHLNKVSKCSVLSGFLQSSRPIYNPAPGIPMSDLIFPFGCNISQKVAVQEALKNTVSSIQGPPGTGKTQTILNLIANLLVQGKNVAVVSNNNSATANVLGKMQMYGLDFVIAFLGSAQNKAGFIEAQINTTIQMPLLSENDESHVRGEIARLNKELDHAFEIKNALALVAQKIDAFLLESAHYEKFLQETMNTDSKAWDRKYSTEASSRKILDHWLALESMENAHKKRNAGVSVGATISSKPPSSFFKKARRFFSKLFKTLCLALRLGFENRVYFDLSVDECVPILRRNYYLRKIKELEKERESISASLQGFKFEESVKQLTTFSMRLLKHHLARRYNNRERKIFTVEDISVDPDGFLREYPIVLSTTFSVITSVKSGYVFDYVVVDEASQVDLLTGVLAMGCAKRIAIVGDPMQLPNVLTEQDIRRALSVAAKYDLPEQFRFERQNLLSAIRIAFPGTPNTLLREHYRCHPKIIEFCNQKFYKGELIAMKPDLGEPDVLKAHVTVEGRHARGNFNQRQIDEIAATVLPELGMIDPSDIGIISPYRTQVARIKSSIGLSDIEVDTVHSYQGREKLAVIVTTVSNEANDFVDNANLLNVAISRAQERFRLVVSKEMAEGNGNIAEFIRYIRYRNCEVVPGKVRSIFDLLYSEYTERRLKRLENQKRISQYDSENLIYGEIEAILKEEGFQGHSVVAQFPLSLIVQDSGHLSPEESSYVSNPWTKADFLIFRKVDKFPVLVVEVDGYSFHRKGTRQAERDALKDSVLKRCGMPIIRLSTVGSNERDLIKSKLEGILGSKERPMGESTI